MNDELLYSHNTAAVQGVTVTPLTDTSVTVSWSPVVIPNFPIETYTVVYSPVSESRRRQDGEMTAEFPGPVTSGVITDLDLALSYQFQVFATVTVDGVPLEGERSTPDTISEYHKLTFTSVVILCVSQEGRSMMVVMVVALMLAVWLVV